MPAECACRSLPAKDGDDLFDHYRHAQERLGPENPLTRADLDDFLGLYQADDRQQRQATWSPEAPDGRLACYSYEELYSYKELAARDKTSLDIFWLKDESLADSDNLPAPGVIAREIVEDLQAALAQFRLIADDLGDLVEA